MHTAPHTSPILPRHSLFHTVGKTLHIILHAQDRHVTHHSQAAAAEQISTSSFLTQRWSQCKRRERELACMHMLPKLQSMALTRLLSRLGTSINHLCQQVRPQLGSSLLFFYLPAVHAWILPQLWIDIYIVSLAIPSFFIFSSRIRIKKRSSSFKSTNCCLNYMHD